MNTSEILKRVRQVEIKTRGLSRNIFAGEYHTAFKGRGMTFAEVREYGFGDDVRTIDWNVTARFNRPFVKVFEEERELTVMLLIDVSGSREFGSTVKSKKNIITEIAATLAFSAIQNNDKIGVIFFSDRIEQFIPPQKGRKHILYIIRELVGLEPQSRRTDIGAAMRYFTNAIKKRCTAFLISDFMDEDFADALTVANRKHDLVALQVYDRLETALPSVGLIKLRDAETGESAWTDSSDHRLRKAYRRDWDERQQTLAELMRRSGIDHVSVETGEDYVRALMRLFRQRS